MGVISLMYMAIPLGIIGEAFSQIWKDRDRILLMHRTRAKLVTSGFGPQDIPVLFSLFDSNNDGELDVTDFKRMISQMKIGLSDDRVVALFESFDADGSGQVDDQEFVKLLFPADYHTMYCDAAFYNNSPDEEEGARVSMNERAE